MNDRLKRYIQLSSLLCVSFGAVSAADTALNSEFFPDLGNRSDESIRLHGLAALYPGTVLFEKPQLATRSQREEAASIETLPQEITYVRIYRLDEAITALQEVIDHPALILDMRYLQSECSGVELANLFSNASQQASITAVGKVTVEVRGSKEQATHSSAHRTHPAIVLCNRETAGPFEAMLHSLQSNDSLIMIGESTAGRTGFYHSIDDSTWMIEGEVRPTADLSILGTGVTPKIQVETTATSNYTSYHLYEAGVSMKRLLRNETALSTTEEHSTSDTEEPQKVNQPDLVLQRAVDIVAALKILQQLPLNK